MTTNPTETGPPHGQLKHQSARGGMITLAAQGVKFSMNLAGVFVLSRLLLPDDFGLVAMVTALTGITTVIKDMGLAAAIVQRPTVSHAEVNSLFWINVTISFVISIALGLSAPAFVWFYGREELRHIVVAFAACFFVGSLGAQHQALLSRGMKFSKLAATDIAAVLAGNAAGFTMAWMHCGYWSLVGMQVALAVVTTAGQWLASGWMPGRPQFQRSVLPMLSFGAGLTGVHFMNYTSRNVDNVLIGRFAGTLQLGFYSRAYQLLMLPLNQISSPITAVAIPALSRLVDDPARYRRAFMEIVDKVLLVTLPAMAFLMAASDLVVELALGSQWSETSRLFAWLAVMGFTQPLTNATGWLFITQGRTPEFFRWATFNCVVSVIAIVAGLPWGALGVARSYAVAGLLIGTPSILWWAGRQGPVGTRDLWRCFAAAAPSGIVVWLTIWRLNPLLHNLPNLPRLAALAAAAGGAVLLLLLVTPSGRATLRDGLHLARGRTLKS